MINTLSDEERQFFHAIYRGNAQLCERLVHDGVNPDVEDPFCGMRPIHLAASVGNTDIIELLLNDQRIRADIPDRRGKVPYEWAADFDHAKAEALLVDHILQNPHRYGKSSLGLARYHLTLKHEPF
jgi:hypothetical protein